jgi:hypothetical protein
MARSRPCFVFGRARFLEKRPADLFDVDTTVLHRLNAVDDFKEPARGVVRIRKVTFGGVLHALRNAFGIVDDLAPVGTKI